MDFVKKASAVVGLVSGIVGLVIVVMSQLHSGSKQSGAHDLTIRLGHVALTVPRTHGQFLDDSDRSKRGFTSAQLAEPGAMSVFPVSITGYKGKQLTLQRQLYDLRTGKVLRAREFGLVPQADVYRDHPWQDWIPLPRLRGSYLLVFKMFVKGDPVATSCTQSDAFGAIPVDPKSVPKICSPLS